MSHSKSLAGNHAINTAVGLRAPRITDTNDASNHDSLLAKNKLAGGRVGRIGGLAMASISSYNIANINR